MTNFKIFFFGLKKKKNILLVWPIEEISLQPELSSPARFRIQGGYPEPDGEGQTEILMSNIGCLNTYWNTFDTINTSDTIKTIS